MKTTVKENKKLIMENTDDDLPYDPDWDELIYSIAQAIEDNAGTVEYDCPAISESIVDEEKSVEFVVDLKSGTQVKIIVSR